MDTHAVVEITNFQNVIHIGHTVRHPQVSLRISQEDNVTVLFQLREVLRAPQGAVVLVKDMNQFSLKPSDHPLKKADDVIGQRDTFP